MQDGGRAGESSHDSENRFLDPETKGDDMLEEGTTPESPGGAKDKSEREKTGAAEVFESLDDDIRVLAPAVHKPDADELERSYSIMEKLLDVSTSISSTLNLKDLLEKIVDAVVVITGCNRGYLMLRDEKGKLRLALSRSKDGKAMPSDDFDLSQSVIAKAAELGEPQVVRNAQEEDDFKNQRSIVDLDIRTVIAIPLKFEAHLVGVIYGDSDSVSETFPSSHVSILKAFGAQAAVAIDNARRHGELEDLKNSLEKQNTSLRKELAERYEFSGIVGQSSAMQDIFKVITKVAQFSTTVLIQGETGTGKELIAKAVHYNSGRKQNAIVSINCGALPKDILESELYGYRRGAFTGADQDRAGLFEAADGGTLFLDEIAEMPIELQVKLLRSLQEGEIRRLGEDRSRKIDVRVIAATNRDLAVEVEEGRFRSDLYYRLDVVPIYLPPLRERQEDILPLAEFFLDKYAGEMGKTKPMLSRSAKQMLLDYSWSGNVRELENAIQRAIALGEGRKTLDADQFAHLVKKSRSDELLSEALPLKKMLQLLEKDFIRKMLFNHGGNITKTADALGISRQQLHNKINKFNLPKAQ